MLISVDCNPCQVLQSPAEKELAWIHAHGQPRFPFERAYRETLGYKKQDPEKHAKSLAQYMRIAHHLVPTDSALNQPVLRHPDLQPNNIFVSEDFSITGLIDWQHSVVLPTFLAAGMPPCSRTMMMKNLWPLFPHGFPKALLP